MACGSVDHIFEKPLPENPMLFESLSPWKHIKSIDNPSFAEIFGELHFKEKHNVHIHRSPVSPSSSFSSNSSIYLPQIDSKTKSTTSSYCQRKQYRHSDSFSSMNSESLSMCTEGLGFESFDDADDLFRDDDDNVDRRKENRRHHHHQRSISTSRGELPPPISCIGRSGKPWVCFRSYREDGRFILKEVRIPTQEFLHACRENGRLKLRFIQHDEDEDKEEDEYDIQKQNQDDASNNGNVQDGDCNNSQILLV